MSFSPLKRTQQGLFDVIIGISDVTYIQVDSWHCILTHSTWIHGFHLGQERGGGVLFPVRPRAVDWLAVAVSSLRKCATHVTGGGNSMYISRSSAVKFGQCDHCTRREVIWKPPISKLTQWRSGPLNTYLSKFIIETLNSKHSYLLNDISTWDHAKTILKHCSEMILLASSLAILPTLSWHS